MLRSPLQGISGCVAVGRPLPRIARGAHTAPGLRLWCRCQCRNPETLRAVPAERLLNPPDGEWPMIRRTYDGWGYSPLSQITTDNVSAAAGLGVFHLDGERT